jgi:hypothetical protein
MQKTTPRRPAHVDQVSLLHKLTRKQMALYGANLVIVTALVVLVILTAIFHLHDPLSRDSEHVFWIDFSLNALFVTSIVLFGLSDFIGFVRVDKVLER